MAERSLRTYEREFVWCWGLECSCKLSSCSINASDQSPQQFILDSARSFGLSSPDTQPPRDAPLAVRKTLLLFSANHTESLKTVANGCQTYLEKSPDHLESLAYTLAERREHLKLRGFGITNSLSPFQLISHTKDQRQGPGKVAFVFTGQGAQWVHMGRELIREYPEFRKSLDMMDQVLQSLEHAPTWTIADTLLSVGDKTILAKPEFSQPICTALQVALVDFLAAWQVTPAAVIGHSSGEIAAAYAVGALSMREAVIVAFYRGYVCTNPQKRGGMAAIGLGRDDVQPYLVPGVRIACENSGKSVTLSGDVQPLEESMAAIKVDHPDTLVRKLQVDVAYHSRKSLLDTHSPNNISSSDAVS
jgi:acyl transferase domain-containing protein